MDSAIIDASVAIKWIVAEPGSDEAFKLAQSSRLIAPRLLLVECANVLWAKTRRRGITPDEAAEGFSYIAAAPIHYLEDGDLLPDALVLAGQLDHPVYDCLYVAAARATEAPLVTADGKLHRKLSAAGPSLYRSILLGDLKP